MNVLNPNGIQVGDTIEVQQAWEDEAGIYHDEYAEVLEVDEHGFMKLDFGSKDLNEWLDGGTWEAKDFAPEPRKCTSTSPTHRTNVNAGISDCTLMHEPEDGVPIVHSAGDEE